MEYQIRKMEPAEYPLLKDFLYEAIFQRDDTKLLPKSIIEQPELNVYIRNFGNEKDDQCFCAEVQGKVVGAVWVRIIEGYGNVDNKTPEVAISLFKPFRGYKIGTQMMKKMIEHLKRLGYTKTSLAVQKDNYAVQMYLKVGFEIIDENEEEYIMIYKLR